MNKSLKTADASHEEKAEKVTRVHRPRTSKGASTASRTTATKGKVGHRATSKTTATRRRKNPGVPAESTGEIPSPKAIQKESETNVESGKKDEEKSDISISEIKIGEDKKDAEENKTVHASTQIKAVPEEERKAEETHVTPEQPHLQVPPVPAETESQPQVTFLPHRAIELERNIIEQQSTAETQREVKPAAPQPILAPRAPASNQGSSHTDHQPTPSAQSRYPQSNPHGHDAFHNNRHSHFSTRDDRHQKHWNNSSHQPDMKPRQPSDARTIPQKLHERTAAPIRPTNGYAISDTLKSLGEFIAGQANLPDIREERREAPGYKLIVESIKSSIQQILLVLGEKLPTQPAPKPQSDSRTLISSIRENLGAVIEVVQNLEYNLSLMLMYDYVLKQIRRQIQEHGQIANEDRIRINAKAKEIQESISTLTLGALISAIADTRIFEKSDLDELKDILTTRNTMVHQLFKTTSYEDNIENKDLLQNTNNRLIRFHNRVLGFNSMVSKLINQMNQRLQSLNSEN